MAHCCSFRAANPHFAWEAVPRPRLVRRCQDGLCLLGFGFCIRHSPSVQCAKLPAECFTGPEAMVHKSGGPYSWRLLWENAHRDGEDRCIGHVPWILSSYLILEDRFLSAGGNAGRRGSGNTILKIWYSLTACGPLLSLNSLLLVVCSVHVLNFRLHT